VRRSIRYSLAAALLTSILLGRILPTRASADGEPAPRLVVLADSIVASDVLSWSVPFDVQNPTAYGIYADSLVCLVESHDPGETRAPRTFRLRLPGAERLLPSVSGNDDARFQYEIRACAESAKLTFQLFTHQSSGPIAPIVAAVEARPGPLSARYPSKFLTLKGGRIEYLLVQPEDSTAAPGLLLIHDQGSNARLMLGRAYQLSRRGYAIMVASMPGYGLSSGSADLGGPATVQAMSAALDALAHAPGVDPGRLAVWGISRGAGVAAALATQRHDLRGAIAQSGIYDLWATYRGSTDAGFRDSLVAEAGTDSAAWRARSPACATLKGGSPLLILHGERDTVVPAAQAHAYFEALKAAGVAAEARFIPNGEHSLLGPDVDRAAVEFLGRRFKR